MDQAKTLQEWLSSLDLGHLVNHFYNAGLSEIEHCRDLDEGFLNDLGISKPEHRKKILQSLNPAAPSSKNATVPPPDGTTQRQEVYINYPLNQEDDSIYVNYVAESSQLKRALLSCRQTAQHFVKSDNSVEPIAGASSIRKKPIPKPRTKKSGISNSSLSTSCETVTSPTPRTNSSLSSSCETVTSPTPRTRPSLQKQPSINVEGVTNGESSTDDFVNQDLLSELNKDLSCNHGNSEKAEKEIPTAAQNDLFLMNKTDGFNAHFDGVCNPQSKQSSHGVKESYVNVDTLVDQSYEPIWMSSSAQHKSSFFNESKDLSSVSSISPEAPPPCRTHFPFEGNVLDSTGTSATSTSFDMSPFMPDIKPNISLSPEEDIYENACINPSCKPPPVEDSSSSCDVPNRDDSTLSPNNSFEDLPPPEFPPPPLPNDSKHVSLVDLAEFDPLLIPSVPPVPPRSDSIQRVTSSDYINTKETNKQTSVDTKSSPALERVYSLAVPTSSLTPTTEPATSGPPSHSFSKPSLKTQMSTISSTSTDPFHGEDPFQGDSNFANECANFNMLNINQENCVENENSADYEDFDPFGLNQRSSQSSKGGSVLSEVPPVPQWNQTTDLPNESLYALAQPGKMVLESTDESSDDVNSEDPLDGCNMSPVGSPTSYAVNIIPPNQQVKKYERAQHLYKQGGVKGNKGWRKRWVVFTGQSLRYYANSKSQVSKRIIPLSCMKKVNILVKENDKYKFKFNLETPSRTFQFAAESLDDCTFWSNTLMAAILKYKPPPGGEKEGGDMNDPDKQGYIRFEKKDRRYFAIKQSKLCYYNSEQDFKQASPIHEIEMKLASVKDLSKDKLQLSTHYAHFTLVFDSYQECVLWRMAIEEGIATGLGDNTVLDQIQENASNKVCADCGMAEAHWASINLGIVLCKKCAGIHRNFESRISRVKSLRMDTRIWTPSLIEMMKIIGNVNSKSFWEKHMPASEKINEDTPSDLRKSHIENKYKKRKYCDKHSAAENQKALNEMLLLSAKSSDVLVTMQILFSGANIMYRNAEGENAFQIAKRTGERIQMEFLLHNGGNRLSSGFADLDEERAAKLRAEVCLSGYLMKTGSNMKDFLKRWCVVEHGCLRYFASEKSSVAKDSIEGENMLCVQAVPVERYQEAFELSTTKEKNHRVFLFAASSVEEKLTWLRTLCKLFCPPPLMEDIGLMEFTLAGNFYVKAGVTSSWEKTWLLMNKKVVQFTDKDLKMSEYIDLRKAKNIQRQETISTCSYCLENGHCLALDIPGRALYFQADLRRDTERLYAAFDKEMRAGGDYLDDQQLNNEDVPIIVDKCLKFIEDNGIFHEGVYRHPGVKSKVQLLLDKFKSDAHSIILTPGVHQVDEVASCLKQFFRGLKEPLLTSSRYKDWIENAGRKDETAKLEWYRYLIEYLPPVHNVTLKRLVRHFVKLSEHSSQNKMTKENIAIAFGPSLMESGIDKAPVGSHVQLQMLVIGDIMNFHELLFEPDEDEKDKEELIQDAIKRIEEVNKISRVPSKRLDSIKVPIHFLHHTNHSELLEINPLTTARQLLTNLRHRMKIKEGGFVIHEDICNGQITRPLHPSDNVFNVVMEWANWGEAYRNNACLCLKPESELVEKLLRAYNPSRSLFAELKFIEKKKAVKYAFEFKQSKLAYYKDLKSNVSKATNSWNIEDIVVYMGMDALAKKLTNKFGLSFMKKGDKPGSKDMPGFGRVLCFQVVDDLLLWMSAMLIAQHPEGLMS